MIDHTFKGSNSFKIVLRYFLKGVYFIRKEFAPKGVKFFPLRVDPFQKGLKNKQEIPEAAYLVKNTIRPV